MKRKFLTFFVVSSLLGLTHTAFAQVQDPNSDIALPYPAVITKTTPIPSDEGEGIRYDVRFLRGPEKSKTVTIDDTPSTVTVGFNTYRVGQKVLVAKLTKVEGAVQYLITDYERRNRVWMVVGLFVLAVIWFSRWRGLRSILGLLFSYLVIIYWVVPQVVHGHNPVTASIIGGTVIMLSSLFITEGWKRESQAAATGMMVTMLGIGFLSTWAMGFTFLTGGGSEEAFVLQGQGYGNIDIRGLLLAGFIIGTLGILDDVAIAQVATVAELRRASRTMTNRAVYQSAMRVGRSHMAAIVNTLVLAYAGASLPLLVLFGAGHASFGDVVNGEVVATEIIRSVIGSLGLVMAMPITTLVAIWFGVRSDHPAEEHHHHSSSVG
ncbi:MAG: YibE/F family protein [Candidatus Kerfeldbacteria bacterium]|nr:YibE/F family protein [Candidatus Kerfeldbacteria bacterium]